MRPRRARHWRWPSKFFFPVIFAFCLLIGCASIESPPEYVSKSPDEKKSAPPGEVESRFERSDRDASERTKIELEERRTEGEKKAQLAPKKRNGDMAKREEKASRAPAQPNGPESGKAELSKRKLPPSRPTEGLPLAPDGHGESAVYGIVRQIVYLWPDSFIAGKPEDVIIEIRLPDEKAAAGEKARGKAEISVKSKMPEPRLRVTLKVHGFEPVEEAEQEIKIPRAQNTFLKWVVVPKEGSAHEFNFSFKAEYEADDFRPVKVEPYKFTVRVRGTLGVPPWVVDWPMKVFASISGFFVFLGGVVSGVENSRKLWHWLTGRGSPP